MSKETKSKDNSSIDILINEIKLLRKEKEEEMTLRHEADKQIELALQKTGEIQKRISDWSTIQDAAMKDSKSAMIDIGNELYKKLTRNFQIEVDEIKQLLEQMNKKIESLKN